MPDTATLPAGVIHLPQDEYLHPTAGNEWWWHVGTLTAGEHVFGFEINAALRTFGGQKVLFSQIMLTDVQGQVHYQKTTGFPYNPAWAESDPRKPWYVSLGSPGADGSVQMSAAASDVERLKVRAGFLDAATNRQINFNLEMHQEGAPLLVWGTGVNPGTGPIDPQHQNFYYSFTRLHVTGTVMLGGVVIPVGGLTWMDHEYGVFPASTTWILQDAQLDNGVHLSCFSTQAPREGVRQPSKVTVLSPAGLSTYHDSFTTPHGPVWTSPEGVSYCTKFSVEIPDFAAKLSFTSLMPDQEFRGAPPVYEGVGSVEGSMRGAPVKGTAWIEQALAPA